MCKILKPENLKQLFFKDEYHRKLNFPSNEAVEDIIFNLKLHGRTKLFISLAKQKQYGSVPLAEDEELVMFSPLIEIFFFLGGGGMFETTKETIF